MNEEGKIQSLPGSKVQLDPSPPEVQLTPQFKQLLADYLRSDEGRAVLREILNEERGMNHSTRNERSARGGDGGN